MAKTAHSSYNPMWRFFGERADGPPGTHFYAAGGKPIAYFWNMFDQVLVRPDLIDALVEVAIIDRIGGTSLLNAAGQPDVGVGSDHLPLVFVLGTGNKYEVQIAADTLRDLWPEHD